MSQLHVAGVVSREIKGPMPTTWLALAPSEGNTSNIVRNSVAAAISN